MGKSTSKGRDRPAMTPDRLLARFETEVNTDGTARIMRIEVDRYKVMTVRAKVANRMWIRSKIINDGWGWEAVLKDWRFYRDCWEMNRRAS